MASDFGTVILIPAVPQILAEFELDRDGPYLVLIVSLWELGEGIGPFLFGPLSEKYGRLPVFHIGNMAFIIVSLVSSFSSNVAMLMALRFLNGVANGGLTLGPAMVGDCFRPEERGTSMAFAVAIPLMGSITAPIVGSYTAATIGWRWSIRIVALAVASVAAVSACCLRETYRVVLLQRRRASQRASAAADCILPPVENCGDRDRGRSPLLPPEIWRPVQLFFGCPIAFVVITYTAFTYGLLYIVVTTLTPVMEDVYAISEKEVGLTYLGRAIGCVLAILVYGSLADRYIKSRKRTSDKARARDCLVFVMAGSILIPLGLFLYGWTLQYKIMFVAPIAATGIVGFGVLMSIISAENFLVDYFECYSASAVAACVIFRAIMGTVFPLLGPPLFERLSYGWGSTVLAFAFFAWVPVICYTFCRGSKLDQWKSVLSRN